MFRELKQGSQIEHKCPTCGKNHKEIPKAAKPYFLDDKGTVIMAWDFQCSCGSNMYIKNYDDLTDIMGVA